MEHLSWTRAAYVFFVLSIVAALLKLGSMAFGEPLPLVSEKTPDSAAGTEVTERESSPEEGSGQRMELANAAPAGVNLSRKPSGARKAAGAVENPPVFYRPAPTFAGRGSYGVSSVSTGPVCDDLRGFPGGSKIVFPLAKRYFDSYDDTWGAPRPQGGHEGTDLMAPGGTPEFAVTDGTIVPVSGANENGWNTLGGYTVMLEAAYDIGPVKKGDLFYYAHMDRESTLRIGTKVRAGQVVGYAGDTGQGPEVTRGLFPTHLHFGWYDASGARSSLASGAMNPYPLLEWVKQNGGTVSGGTGTRYCEAPQSGPPVPSTGEKYWPFPSSPGERPDLDSGSDARPSPVAKRSAPAAERVSGLQEEEVHRKDDGAKPSKPPKKEPSEPARKGEVPDTPENNAPEETVPQREAPRFEPPVGAGPADAIEKAGEPRANVDELKRWILRIVKPPDEDRRSPGEKGGGKKNKKDRGDGKEKPAIRDKQRPKPPREDAGQGCGTSQGSAACEDETDPPVEQTTPEETTSWTPPGEVTAPESVEKTQPATETTAPAS